MKFEAVNQLFIQSLLIPTYKQQFSSCNRLKIARYSFVNIHLKLTSCKRSEFKILRRTQVITLVYYFQIVEAYIFGHCINRACIER